MAERDPRTVTSGWRALPGWVPAVAACLAVLLVYARAMQGDFLWDDDAHITANPTIVGPLGLKEIWTSGKANYFPLTMTSFWVQHALWGLSPAPYHVVSVLFHLGAVLALWRVLRRLEVPGAWLGAMLWGLHPVQVESVAWICELKNTQSGFFYLLAIWFFVRWMSAGGRMSVRRDYVLAIVAAVLAILSKSSTAMLPVVFGLLGWWRGRRRWSDAVWLAPFFVVSLAASGWTIWEQKVNSMASGPEWDHGLAARCAIAGRVPWFYLGKLLWPEPLIFIYPRWDVSVLGVTDWLPLLAAVGFVAALLWKREGRGAPLFVAFAYFGVSLFPVLGLFDVFFFRYSFVGDHFQYLASMGPLALLGAAIVRGADFAGARGARLSLACGGALVALFALMTWHQSRIYFSREALWRDTVALNPHAWIAQMNLGSELMSTGRAPAAVPHFRAAVQLKPLDALGEANWGAALVLSGQPAEAVPHLERAVQLMPKLAEAHNTLGVALKHLGRASDAVVHAKMAVELTPQSERAHANLAECLLSLGDPAGALDAALAALRFRPDALEAHFVAGTAALMLGRNDAAIPHFEAILAARPDHIDARSNLAGALYRSGRAAEAVPHYETVSRLQPDSSAARNNFASALLQAGQFAPALAQYREALRLAPDSLEARTNLALALARAGQSEDAARECLEILRRQPDHAPARELLENLKRAAGENAERR